MPAAGSGAARSQEETSIWRFFLGARVLQAIVLIAVLANFVIAGAFEVALPALAHARFGPAGYGALIACFGVGSLTGTLVAAKLSALRRPALAACGSFLIGGLAVSFVPFLGGLPGAAAAALVFGAAGYFGNVIIVTLLQQWAPAQLLGRVMSLVMLASIGAFPASVALSGVIVHNIGPAPFFPTAGVDPRPGRAAGRDDQGVPRLRRYLGTVSSIRRLWWRPGRSPTAGRRRGRRRSAASASRAARADPSAASSRVPR